MTKALFKKQMMESFAWVYRDRKTGKNRTGAGLVIYLLLYVVVFGMLGSMFYMMAESLCPPLIQMDLGWLYFAIMGLVSVVLGVFASVFNTAEALYRAKDNDLLLSMPIPIDRIIAARLSGVYALGLLYELFAMVPTLMVWFDSFEISAAGVVFSLLIPIVLSVFVLTLSCILGWVVSLISGKSKNKSFVTVILSLAFLGAYYAFYFNAYKILLEVLANAQSIATNVSGFWNPLYLMGLAAEGKVLPMISFTGMVIVLFAVVYFIINRSFLRITTANPGAAKVKYRKGTMKAGSADGALFRKELKRFAGSSTYMMNCGLGIIFMIVAAAALLLQRDVITEVAFGMFEGHEDLLPLLAVAAVCMLTTMNDTTAPSISLEGKNLWLIKVLPISGWQVLKAKLKLHLLLTFVPATILVASVETIFCFDLLSSILIPAVAALYILLMGEIGLVLNLLMPNLNWTSEVAPVKQSAAVMITLFGGWAIVIAIGALYAALASFIKPALYMVIVCVVLLVPAVAVYLWLKYKGARIFASL